ncbi:MAG: multiple resistance and pH regulation protein F [Alphaproteobacteria bacterium]|nr:multiple resistance and pH regulation protein F [Alphaproteobacteria bacterium]
MIAAVASIGALLVAAPALVRLWRGPTAADRLAAGYLIGIAIAAALAACGAAAKSDAVVTLAIVLALVQNVVFVAALKAARRNSYQPALAALRRARDSAG